jgi:CheY-like chemotaxis protein
VHARPLVLVIEDSDDTRDMLTTLLDLEGFAIQEARDGREGVELAVRYRPSLIIADLQMPIMDGREAIRRLRADSRTRHIPIILCSGEEPARKEHMPADVFLPKPCSLDLLLSVVRTLVRRQTA